jgi:hypothetical protein
MILTAHSMGIDLAELLPLRRSLMNWGNLLNQSLRTSWGKSVDGEAAAVMVKRLREVVM